jgi:hypothetical protein
VSAALRRHGEDGGGPELLTTRHPDRLSASYGRLVAGVELAVRVAPDLALDLLPHVALFAVTADPSGRLGSASAREYPGLILLPEPRTAVEVAEALVHEGAHQKFFDLAITRSIFGPGATGAPVFRPSWAPGSAPPWPLEQVFAAWHAYRCLEVFVGCLTASAAGTALHEDSLLPEAASRVAEIGAWLRLHGRYLGADAHELIEALDGVRPAGRPDGEDVELPAMARLAESPGTLLRPAGSRTLVATRSTPPNLYWLRNASPSSIDVR